MRKKNLKNKGFALLFSVLLSSLLLTIGLSIFSIALKELSISTAVRQSVHAFYAADSGRECAIYWDVKGGQIPTIVNDQIQGTIACGSLTNVSVSSDDGGATSRIPDTTTKTIRIMSDVVGGDYANFYVDIQKDWNDPILEDRIKTTVTAYGYDSANDDRVERAIEQTY
ncbi:MAG: hypothetical protein WC027_01175 [Candidatus Paceibacterota bacterium]